MLRTDLALSASAALDCLGVGVSDDVLVVYNNPQQDIAEVLARTADGRARRVRLVRYPTLTRDGEEPPRYVSQAMADATVILCPTTCSLSHTQARLEATSRGTRIATMPGITSEIFARALPVDYLRLKRMSDQIAIALTAASTCRVMSRTGTDVVLSLANRSAISDNGNLHEPSAFGNLPAGEAYIAPVETSAEGTIVFDGALAGYGLLANPLKLTVTGGWITAAEGEAAQWILDTLDAGGTTGRLIAELGIGTNPGAHISGQIIEDEKALGTGHFAFGMSASFGGSNVSAVHIDGMMLHPIIELDGQQLLIEDLCENPTEFDAQDAVDPSVAVVKWDWPKK